MCYYPTPAPTLFPSRATYAWPSPVQEGWHRGWSRQGGVPLSCPLSSLRVIIKIAAFPSTVYPAPSANRGFATQKKQCLRAHTPGHPGQGRSMRHIRAHPSRSPSHPRHRPRPIIATSAPRLPARPQRVPRRDPDKCALPNACTRSAVHIRAQERRTIATP